MKKQERLVFFYDLVIDAYSRKFDAPQTISVEKAIELVESVDREQWIKEQAKGRERLYVSDYRHDGNMVSFLINKSDSAYVHPLGVARSLETSARRHDGHTGGASDLPARPQRSTCHHRRGL